MIARTIPLVLGILFAVITVGGYAYLLQGINASIMAVATIEGDIASAGKRASFADSMQAFLADTASTRAELDTLIVDDDIVAGLIEAIEAEARRDKVVMTVSSITKGTEAGWKKHGVIRVNLTAEGSYQALATFATALESLPVGSHLANLSLQATGEKAGAPWFGEFAVHFVGKQTP